VRFVITRAGFKGGGANWAVAQGLPQLMASTKTVNYYLRKHKNTFRN